MQEVTGRGRGPTQGGAEVRASTKTTPPSVVSSQPGPSRSERWPVPSSRLRRPCAPRRNPVLGSSRALQGVRGQSGPQKGAMDMNEFPNEEQNPRPAPEPGAADDRGDTGATTGLWSGFRVSDGSWEEDAEGQVVEVVSDTPESNASGSSQEAPAWPRAKPRRRRAGHPDQPDPVGGPPADAAVGTSDNDQQPSTTGISDAQLRANRRNSRRSSRPPDTRGQAGQLAERYLTRHLRRAPTHPPGKPRRASW